MNAAQLVVIHLLPGLALLFLPSLLPDLPPPPPPPEAGGRTNAKSQDTIWPRMSVPLSPSMAAFASRCVSYSTSA